MASILTEIGKQKGWVEIYLPSTGETKNYTTQRKVNISIDTEFVDEVLTRVSLKNFFGVILSVKGDAEANAFYGKSLVELMEELTTIFK